jgi:hypothetical protein
MSLLDDIKKQYEIALDHYDGGRTKAREALEWWLRGLNEGEIIRARGEHGDEQSSDEDL